MAHMDTRAQRRPQYNGRFTDATRSEFLSLIR